MINLPQVPRSLPRSLHWCYKAFLLKQDKTKKTFPFPTTFPSGYYCSSHMFPFSQTLSQYTASTSLSLIHLLSDPHIFPLIRKSMVNRQASAHSASEQSQGHWISGFGAPLFFNSLLWGSPPFLFGSIFSKVSAPELSLLYTLSLLSTPPSWFILSSPMAINMTASRLRFPDLPSFWTSHPTDKCLLCDFSI